MQSVVFSSLLTSPLLHLLEVDTLSTGVGTSENFHTSVLQTEATVVGDKWTHTELLKNVSTQSGHRETLIINPLLKP